jgi:hypothetical protein
MSVGYSVVGQRASGPQSGQPGPVASRLLGLRPGEVLRPMNRKARHGRESSKPTSHAVVSGA